MIRTGLTLALGLALLGCAQPTLEQTGFRDLSVPLTITTRGGQDVMNGPWFVRAHYPGDAGISMVTFLADYQGAPAVEFLQTGCDLSGDCDVLSDVWKAQSLGLNRWRLTADGADSPQDLWVVWIDEGARTAALGTPDGSFGWIVDRKPSGGEDRITAAREILEFNGYDISRMVSVKAR